MSWVEEWQQEMKDLRSGGSGPKMDEMEYTTKSGQSMHNAFWDITNGPTFWMLNTHGEDKEIGHDRQPTEIFEVEVSTWGRNTKPIMEMFTRALESDLKDRKHAKGLSVYTNSSQRGSTRSMRHLKRRRR